MTTYTKLVYVGAVKRRTNIYLTVEQLKRLGALGKKKGQTVAALVRLAVDAYLKREKT